MCSAYVNPRTRASRVTTTARLNERDTKTAGRWQNAARNTLAISRLVCETKPFFQALAIRI
jgi:hypothetical protein